MFVQIFKDGALCVNDPALVVSYTGLLATNTFLCAADLGQYANYSLRNLEYSLPTQTQTHLEQ